MESQIKLTSKVTLLHGENLLLVSSGKSFQTIKLEPQISQLLFCLVSSKGEVISKEKLIFSIWKSNVYVGNDALRKNIYRLRNILKDNGLDDSVQILTISKKGYKLVINEYNFINFYRRKRVLAYAIVCILLCFLTLRFTTEEDIDLKLTYNESVSSELESSQPLLLEINSQK